MISGNPVYLMTCGASSPPEFDALDKSSSAVLYSLQLKKDKIHIMFYKIAYL